MNYITKPFKNLRHKTRAVYILHLAGFSHKELSTLLKISERSVTRYILKGNKEYPELDLE